MLALFVLLLAAAPYTVKGKTVLRLTDVQQAVRAVAPSGSKDARNLRITWRGTRANPSMTLRGRRQNPGAVPQQRSLELADDRLLILAVDAGGEIRFWSGIAN